MGEASEIDDRPVTREAADFGALLSIVMHPAFRLGFLDGQEGRPFAHDRILDRIAGETPPTALKRIGWAPGDESPGELFSDAPLPPLKAPDAGAALATYRYEEGRRLSVEFGVRCRAWGHPDFPPAAVMRFVANVAAERAAEAKGVSA